MLNKKLIGVDVTPIFFCLKQTNFYQNSSLSIDIGEFNEYNSFIFRQILYFGGRQF